MKIKKFNETHKKTISNFPDDKLKDMIYNIDKYYDINAAKLNINAMASNLDDVKAGKYQHITLNTEDIIVKGSKLTEIITKQHIIDVAFGGFKDQYKQVNDSYKELEKSFTEFSKGIVDDVTECGLDKDGTLSIEFKPIKEALKELSAYAAAYSRMVIHNSKQLVSVVLKISTKYRKDYK